MIGLGCAIGSVLVGNTQDIAKARHLRKSLGGGMRQSGYLAAAGLYALTHNVTRLQEDHLHATWLAQTLTKNELIDVITVNPDTNIVVFGFHDNNRFNAIDIVSLLKTQYNVWVNAMAGNRIRAVTHLDVKYEDVVHAARMINELVM